MDLHLQKLKRDAVSSGDYTAYEVAVGRSGMVRIALRQLTIIIFRDSNAHIPDAGTVTCTNWSNSDFFQVDSLILHIPRKHLKAGYAGKGGWDRNTRFRVLSVDTKEALTPKEYMDIPTDTDAAKSAITTDHSITKDGILKVRWGDDDRDVIF
jgi:hypothetical protein